MRADHVRRLRELAAEATAGKVTTVLYCAVGPDFATWYGQLGGMTRQDRMALLGQLAMLTADLVDQENESL